MFNICNKSCEWKNDFYYMYIKILHWIANVHLLRQVDLFFPLYFQKIRGWGNFYVKYSVCVHSTLGGKFHYFCVIEIYFRVTVTEDTLFPFDCCITFGWHICLWMHGTVNPIGYIHVFCLSVFAFCLLYLCFKHIWFINLYAPELLCCLSAAITDPASV